MNGPYFDAEVFIRNTLKQKLVMKFMLLRSCVTVICIKILYKSKKHSPASFLTVYCVQLNWLYMRYAPVG